MMARALGVVACGMVILAPAASRAQSRKVMQACERTYQRGVKLERAGKLLEAHKAMETCATDVCGSFLEHQCSAGRDRLLSDMPSVVPVVIDENGAPLTDVEVTMDDEPLRSHLDGRAIRVDPGMHEFSFKRNALVIGTQKIVAIQGKRNQPVVLRLHPAKPAEVPKLKDEQPAAKPPVQVPAAALAEVPPDRTPKRPSYVGSYVLMGSGLVAIAGYGVLTYWGRSDNDQLAQCTPNCLQASVDHIHNLYLAADISLGVGIAAVVTGGYWWWRNHSSVSVSVGPTYASIGGAF